MMPPVECIDTTLGLPEELGIVRDHYQGSDPERFVLIFQDDPENWSIRWAIGKTLHHFNWVSQVGRDGASLTIDTSLMYAIPDEQIRKESALYFLQKLFIDGAEYANVLRGESPIKLFGVEDPQQYKQAQKLYKSQPDFLRHQIKRAQTITRNLLHEMNERETPIAALTCCGDLPDLVSERLEQQEISYAIIRPRMNHPSDRQSYLNLLRGIFPSDEEILQDSQVETEIPPEQANFPDKEAEETKETFRRNLVARITSGGLLPEMKALPTAEYDRMAAIINATEHGPKTKAVLVKAELLALIESGKAHMAAVKRTHAISDIVQYAGIIGVLLACVGALFGFVARPWFVKGIGVLLGSVVVVKAFTRRFTHAFGWLLMVAGFLGGYSLWGRWGAMLGIVIASLFWHLALPKQDIPYKEYEILKNWKGIE